MTLLFQYNVEKINLKKHIQTINDKFNDTCNPKRPIAIGCLKK